MIYFQRQRIDQKPEHGSMEDGKRRFVASNVSLGSQSTYWLGGYYTLQRVRMCCSLCLEDLLSQDPWGFLFF